MDKYSVLKEKFGFDTFREGQEEVIDAIMDTSKKGILSVMATGKGKSITFQIPALLFGGLNIVISPLISLMQDQVQALKAKGIAAEFYNSSLNETEKRDILNSLNFGMIELLYVAPERFEDDSFTSVLQSCNVNLFVIDEAHCVSQYGDFRPSYRRLRRAIESINPVQVAAFTATATKRTQADICRQLGFVSPKKFIKGFYRDNLNLEINANMAGKDMFQRVIDDIIAFREDGIKTGIVYTATRKDAEALGALLSEEQYGIKNFVYHGGQTDAIRKEVLEKWMTEGGIAVATNSLGMGVDKGDIGFIIHLGMTGCVEDYAQQVGRGGRNGEEAHCIMYSNLKKELWLQNFFINGTCPPSYVVRKFWEWINNESRKHKDNKIELTQEQMEQISGIEKGTVGGCISVLKTAGLVETLKKGEYSVNYHTNPHTANINYPALEEKRKIKTDKLADMVAFLNNKTQCRQLALMDYFDDKSRTEPCGKCDICIKNKKR